MVRLSTELGSEGFLFDTTLLASADNTSRVRSADLRRLRIVDGIAYLPVANLLHQKFDQSSGGYFSEIDVGFGRLQPWQFRVVEARRQDVLVVLCNGPRKSAAPLMARPHAFAA